jgi:hypothetical protein
MDIIDITNNDHMIYFIGMSNSVKICEVIWFIFLFSIILLKLKLNYSVFVFIWHNALKRGFMNFAIINDLMTVLQSKPNLFALDNNIN